MMLEVADVNEGVQKTKLMYSSYLSTAQLRHYLNEALTRELLLFDRKTKTYRTTPKGQRLIKLSRGLQDMIPVHKLL